MRGLLLLADVDFGRFRAVVGKHFLQVGLGHLLRVEVVLSDLFVQIDLGQLLLAVLGRSAATNLRGIILVAEAVAVVPHVAMVGDGDLLLMRRRCLW